MAKVGKYIEIQLQEQKHWESYNKRVAEYAVQKKINKASAAELVEMIFNKEITDTYNFLKSNNPQFWGDLIKKVSDSKIPQSYFDVLKKILLQIAKVSDTFFVEVDSLKTIFTIAQMQEDFIRPIEDWVPKSRNRFKQIFELLRHLFAKYDVPEFLDKGFANADLDAITLFLNIGTGKSFKEFELAPKIVLNKKIYHHILSTPEDYTFFEAFRRAQVLSNNGSDKLVQNILGSRLREIKPDEEFWLTVIQFFVAQPMFDYDHVPQIIDYVWNRKFVNRYENNRQLPPAQPDFAIKGRTIQALMRQSEEWHDRQALEARINARLARQNRNNYVARPVVKSWDKVRIPNYDSGGTLDKRYMVIQYSTTAELMQEGADMHHCVGSYAYSCSKGGTSIWSLRVHNKKEVPPLKKLLTIEVDNKNQQIVQIRGRNNRRYEVSEMNILKKWAADANLGIGKYA